MSINKEMKKEEEKQELEVVGTPEPILSQPDPTLDNLKTDQLQLLIDGIDALNKGGGVPILASLKRLGPVIEAVAKRQVFLQGKQ